MSTKNILIGLVLLAVLSVGLYLIFGGKSSGPSYAWVDHYRRDSPDPYGTYLLHELLKGFFPEGNMTVLTDSLPEPNDHPDSLANYVFIGSRIYLDSARMDKLLRWVAAGNDAFIACGVLPLALLDTLSGGECTDLAYLRDSVYFEEPETYFSDSVVSLSLTHGALADTQAFEYKFRVRNEAQLYDWEYFHADLFCEYRTNFAALGHLNGADVNFVKASFGQGHFYLHTTPLAFSNIYLLEQPGLVYAERAFSHLRSRPTYWDSIRRGSGDGADGGSGRPGYGESPLRYILSQPALKWAWYTLLAMAVLYLAFKAKRRQRIIPVLEKNENTSLEFIGTIGRLFFLQNNHRQLALQKMKLFLGFVRDRYQVSTKDLNEVFQKQLTARSEVPEDDIHKILTLHRNIEKSDFASENTLVDFHRAVATFYRTCK